MGTSCNFSPQALGWGQPGSPDAGSVGASLGRGAGGSRLLCWVCLGVCACFAGAVGMDGFQVKTDR